MHGGHFGTSQPNLQLFFTLQGSFRRDESFGRRDIPRDGPQLLRDVTRDGRDIRPFSDERGPHRGGDRDMHRLPVQRPPRDIPPQYEAGNGREPTPPWQYDERLPISEDRRHPSGGWNRLGRGGRGPSPPPGGRPHWQLEDRRQQDNDVLPRGEGGVSWGNGLAREPLDRPIPPSSDSHHPGSHDTGPRLSHAASQSSLSSAGGLGPQRSAPSLKAFMTSRDVSIPPVGVVAGGVGSGAAGAVTGSTGGISNVHETLPRLETTVSFGYGQRAKQQLQSTDSVSALTPPSTVQGLPCRPGLGIGRHISEPSSSNSLPLPAALSPKQFNNDLTGSLPNMPSIRVGSSSSLLLMHRSDSHDLFSPQTSDAAAGGINSPAGGGRRFGFGISRRASIQPMKGSDVNASAAGGEYQPADDEEAVLCQGTVKEEGGSDNDGVNAEPQVDGMQVDPPLGDGGLAESGGDSVAIAVKDEDEQGLDNNVEAAAHADAEETEGGGDGEGDRAGDACKRQHRRQQRPVLGMDEISAQIELLETEIYDLEKLTTSLQISGKQVW